MDTLRFPDTAKALATALFASLLTLAAVGPAGAEVLAIETSQEHFWVPNVEVKGWTFVPDQFEPGAFAVRLFVEIPGMGPREWDSMLPQDRTELLPRPRRNTLLFKDDQGRRFALASETPFGDPGNLFLVPDGVSIEIGEHYQVTVKIDTELNPPVGTAREAVARARFGALFAD